MRAVNIGIRHYDYLAVFQIVYIKILAYTGAERLYYREQLFVRVYLVYPRLLNIEHLSPERQHRLISSVSALLGASARGISLDDEQLRIIGALIGASCKLAKKRRIVCR